MRGGNHGNTHFGHLVGHHSIARELHTALGANMVVIILDIALYHHKQKFCKLCIIGGGGGGGGGR